MNPEQIRHIVVVVVVVIVRDLNARRLPKLALLGPAAARTAPLRTVLLHTRVGRSFEVVT